MTVIGTRVQVTNVPTPLTLDESGDLVSGGSLLVSNSSVANLDLGGDGVATGEGFQLLAGDETSVDLKQDEVLYAVAAAAGPFEVQVLRTGVVL